MSETKKQQGKLAVISGGTTGIGLAAAQLFVKEGAYVFITGRRQKELDEAVQAIGSDVTGVQGDIAKLTDLDRLYNTVATKGRIDVVFANAGVAEFAPLGKITEELSFFVLLHDQTARISRMKASIFFVIRARSGPRFCSRQIPLKNVTIKPARESLSSRDPRAAARLSMSN
jgi:NAD(P)-dependent dehydrogenase (short-subunit alcohol dehydrogenase family)